MQKFSSKLDLLQLTGAKLASLPMGKGGAEVNCVVIPAPQNFIEISEDQKHANLRVRNWDLSHNFIAKYRENHPDAGDNDLPIGQLDVNYKQEDRENLKAKWAEVLTKAHPDWTPDQVQREVSNKTSIHLGLLYAIVPREQGQFHGQAPKMAAPSLEMPAPAEDDLPF